MNVLPYLGQLAGGCFGLGLVIAIDHLGHSGHTIGFVGSLLIGFGCTGLGWLIGKAAGR